MNKGELVSIIVPVYNTPKEFLNECLDSLKSQLYDNIEVIFIDDGSKTETAKYLDTLKEKNIFVYHKNQGGVSSARNYGVKCAKGKYICFVDADDIVSEKFVQNLYLGIKENNTLVSACSLTRIKNISQKRETLEKVTFVKYTNFDIWQHINTGYCVTKMYNKSVFDSIEFDETISMCEDALFVNRLLDKIKSCCVTRTVMYYYRDNPKGSSRLVSYERYLQAIDVSKKIMSLDSVKKVYENLKVYKNFQAVWELKYMLALVNDNAYFDKELIKKRKIQYRRELLPYTKYTKDNRVRLANFLVVVPLNMTVIALKVIIGVIRRKNES